MASRLREVAWVPYGRAHATSPGPEALVAPGVKLRLSDGPYPFAEPPDLIGFATRAERLDLLRDHLRSLCGPWDRLAHFFLDAYFAYIAASLAGAEVELAALALRAGGLFCPADWSFAALRPLPQAHLPPGDAAPARVDFAFWTGAQFVAIELAGSASPRRQRQDELARLAAAGVALVTVPGAALQQEGAQLLARLLPPPLQRFWDGVSLPSSPFGAEALAEIRGA
ncbi:MAG TPA: hypothetical protein VN802_02950 [Stellaceae bacterium]|nr:hypothetical protein [Stellaceae bacterium]